MPDFSPERSCEFTFKKNLFCSPHSESLDRLKTNNPRPEEQAAAAMKFLLKMFRSEAGSSQKSEGITWDQYSTI